jgi:protein-tyrosine phosphatase
MVDIHSHVLWGLDDGSETYEESLAMLQAAAAAGTTDIVATPHANSEYAFDPEQIESKIARLQWSGAPLPRLHRGCDFHLNFDNVQSALEEPGKFTIDHRNYLLVEFPDIAIPAGIDGVFTQFLDRGIVPVITHPERNHLLMQDLPQLAAWVGKGCLLQVTALSLLGGFGSRARSRAWELMDRRLVHAVASDAHDSVRRHPRLDKAHAEVARRAGEDNAALLFDRNPGAIVEGRHPGEIAPMSEFRRRWFLFRR